MCKNACKGCCGPSQAMYWLVIVGALNWGLVGLGGLLGQGNWNLVYLLFGSVMWLEYLVYVLVGASAVGMLVGCKCKKCTAGGGACCGGGKKDMPSNDAAGSDMM